MTEQSHTIALFGEAERGEFHTAYFFQSLVDLAEYVGHPPEDSMGLHYAVQALMYRHQLIFFRVQEEGYSLPDYQHGLELLGNQALIPSLDAVCMPGVGDPGIIDTSAELCLSHRGILITTEADLYDYLTSREEEGLTDQG
jgi:hypothetical protein